MKRRAIIHLFVVVSILLMALPAGLTAQEGKEPQYHIALKSRQFIPGPGVEPALAQALGEARDGRRHVLLQFEDIPTEAQRAALEAAGVRLLGYIPNNAWFASLPAELSVQNSSLSQVRWMGAIQPMDRISPILRERGVGRDMVDEQGQTDLEIRFFSDVSPDEALRVLGAHEATVETKLIDFHRFVVRVDAGAMDALAEEDSVQWITEAPPPKTTYNDGIRARTNVDTVQGGPYNLSGSGVDLGIWDSGTVDSHVDFSGRLTVVEGASVGDHATHVAGTMAGDGSNSASQGGTALQWRGMATGADIISYYWDNNLTDHNGAINTYGIELSQNSWGYTIGEPWPGNCYLYGDYDGGAPDYDDIITGLYGKRIAVVFAVGNERDDGDCGMSSTPPYLNYANVGPPSTAKNVVAVGATNSNDDSMTDFSSWGPLDDGRIKPDVVAPGCESTGEGYIRSTLPGDVYGGLNWCGTSMAAPAVSGISGLIIEQFRTTFGGSDPLPSTLKALLIQTAVDLDDGSTYYNPGPDYASGYGRIDAQAAVDVVIAERVREDQVSHGQTDAFTVNVPAGTPSLKVTLAWDDEPGAVNADPALVNNLDLILVEPNGTTTHLPWVLDPAHPSNNATTGTDSVNNVEQVEVDNPASGTWEVQVVGTSVPVGPQYYSLAGQTFTSSGPGSVGPLVHTGHTVDDDNVNNSSGNDDGIVNPGETIELFVDVLNIGADQATDVYATISTSSPYVTFIYNVGSEYGNIPGGGMATNLNDFDFEVSGSAPDGHVIHFDLDITASNGGPWSDGFDVTVVGDGGGNVALISDQTELQAITFILADMGLTYDVVNNNWNGAQGVYTSDYSFLSNYGLVVWYASGYDWGRLITQQEHDALEQFLQAGGRLLVTGYDTLGSPSDPLLADLVRSSSYGDGPFTYDYTVTDGNHPITDGPYGSFPAGTALIATHYDHDQAEADTGRGAVTVAELSDGHDKIMATELASGGIVVYWNGDYNVSDWTGVLTTLRELEEGGEQKRDVDGRHIGSLSIESLRGQALRVELADNPPEANYGGSEPVWYVPPESLSQLQTDIVPLGSENVTFPASGDVIGVTYDPYWWHAGDYAQGSRTLSLSNVNRVDYNLSMSYNSLSGTGHVDFDLYINGIYVGSFTVWPGEYSRSVSFSFPLISGPVYTIRLEETNTVDPAMGSISIPLDTSSMTFFGPSTEEQVAMLKNTLHWLQGIVVGDPHEPNDSPAECTPIFFDVPITDPTIDPPGDYDYYCFTGGGGQVIAADIDASAVGSPLDSVLTLFDSDGATFLAQNDDYGGLDSYLEVTLPHDGIFYLRVRSYGHPNFGGPDYFYSILLTDVTPSLGLPFFDDMESGSNGWWPSGFWHQVEDGVSPYPNSFSPTHSWWYGQDATGDYDNGVANAGSLTSPPIEIPPGAQVELSFWQWYETEPTLLPQSVYYDAYHGESHITGGTCTDWANNLIDAGYSVVEYNQPIDLATLSGHQVLALFAPRVAFAPAEIAAINAFMQNGGRVVALGEFNDWNGIGTILNVLSAAHGIAFNNDMVLDSTNNDGEDFWPLIYNFADHSLVQGVNMVVLYAGCSLSLSGPAVPLATGDGDATATGIVSTAAEDVGSDGTGLETFAQPQAIVPGAPIMMAYAPVGAGELIAISDSNLWSNVDADGDGIMPLYEYNNETLSRRVFGKEVDHSSWDQKWVQISADGGPFQSLLQVTGGPMNAWHQVHVDLSPYAGTTVRIRYHFDTIDALVNNYRGWYIDDVRVDASDVGPVVYDDHIIDDDNAGESSGDGDGVPDAGETVEMYVELRNNGADAATNVQACITEDSPYVDGFLYNTCSDYGDIPGGGTAANGDDFDFTVDAAAPSGHAIHFDLVVAADNDGPWSVPFEIVVGQGATVGPLIYVNAIIDDDNVGQSVGNGDGQINPGEVIELYVEVGNTGNAAASSVQGCISEYSPYLDGFLYNTCSGYGNLPGGGAATSTNDFDFEVDINAPDGHLISLCMDLSATNGGPWTTCFELPVFDIPSGTALRVEPPDQDVSLYTGPFHADVVIESVNHLGAFEFDLVYDPAIVRVDDVDLGPFLGSTGCSVMEVGPIIDNVAGRVTYGGTIMGTCTGPSGDGVLATVTFHPEVAGESDLILENEQLMNTDNPPVPITPVSLYHGHVTVTSCFFADVDCDDDVDIVDIFNIAYRWGCQCGDACYEPAYDLNDDCSISISDIQIVACYFGWPSGDFSGCYAPSGSSMEPIPGQPSTLRLTPEKAQVWLGESFTVAVDVESVQDLAGFEAILHYGPQVLRFDGLALGDFLTSTGNTVELREAQVDADAGTVTLGGFSFGEHDSPEGSGTLITLTFTVQGFGTSLLILSDVQLARRCGLAHASPTIVGGRVTSGRSLYLPLVLK